MRGGHAQQGFIHRRSFLDNIWHPDLMARAHSAAAALERIFLLLIAFDIARAYRSVNKQWACAALRFIGVAGKHRKLIDAI